jgi:hypothetical protein
VDDHHRDPSCSSYVSRACPSWRTSLTLAGHFGPHQELSSEHLTFITSNNIIKSYTKPLLVKSAVCVNKRFNPESESVSVMSHCHDEHVGHGGHDHHDHEHDHSDDITPALQSSLYQQINFDEITTLNESRRDAGKAIVKKTWAERLSPDPELESDADEQLLMTVPYVHLHPQLHSFTASLFSNPPYLLLNMTSS